MPKIAGMEPKTVLIAGAIGVGIVYLLYRKSGSSSSSSASPLTPAFAPTGTGDLSGVNGVYSPSDQSLADWQQFLTDWASTFGGGYTQGGTVTPTTGGNQGGTGDNTGDGSGGSANAGCSAAGGWVHTGCLKTGAHCTGTAQCPCGQKCHKNGPLDLTGQCGPRPCSGNHNCRPSSSGPAHCNTSTGFCECDTAGSSGSTAQTASASGNVAVAA